MEEKKKNNSGLICLVILLVILVLGLAGYICFDKFYKKSVEPVKVVEKSKEEVKEESPVSKPTTEEDEIYRTDYDDAIVCNSKTRNLVYISYKNFDDRSITKNDVCNTYVIEEFNAKLIPTQIVLEDNEPYFAVWKVLVNGKEEKIEHNYNIKINKYREYYVISDMAMGGGYQNHYIYDKNGQLMIKLDDFDDDNCAYFVDALTENSFILTKHVITNNASGEYGAAGSCVNDDKVKTVCGTRYSAADVSYELVEENNKLSLKELPNPKCK